METKKPKKKKKKTFEQKLKKFAKSMDTPIKTRSYR